MTYIWPQEEKEGLVGIDAHDLAAEEVPEPDFAPWVYHADTDTLVLLDDDGRWLYEVDVEDARRSSAEVLDWITQVSNKLWATERIVARLVVALDHVIGFQGGLIEKHRKRLGQ